MAHIAALLRFVAQCLRAPVLFFSRGLQAVRAVLVVGLIGHQRTPSLLASLPPISAATLSGSDKGFGGVLFLSWPHARVVLKALQKGIDVANAKAASRAQKVQKFAILPTDLSVPGGELTSTQKLKRNVVSTKYAKEIAALYAE